MHWTMEIPTTSWSLLSAKSVKDETTEDAMLTTVVNRYIADVRRESGADVDSNINKRLAEMTSAEKEALAASLGIAA